jgi:hypothetical protein
MEKYLLALSLYYQFLMPLLVVKYLIGQTQLQMTLILKPEDSVKDEP